MAPPPRPPPPPPPPAPVADPAQMKLDISPLAGSERIGGRQRDKSSVYAAESEALDQIAKEVRISNRYVNRLQDHRIIKQIALKQNIIHNFLYVLLVSTAISKQMIFKITLPFVQYKL